jgi:hypothetical protein
LFVIALTVTLVIGTFVPSILTAPNAQVVPPLEYVWDSAGGAWAVCASRLHPDTRNGNVNASMQVIFIIELS